MLRLEWLRWQVRHPQAERMTMMTTRILIVVMVMVAMVMMRMITMPRTNQLLPDPLDEELCVRIHKDVLARRQARPASQARSRRRRRRRRVRQQHSLPTGGCGGRRRLVGSCVRVGPAALKTIVHPLNSNNSNSNSNSNNPGDSACRIGMTADARRAAALSSTHRCEPCDELQRDPEELRGERLDEDVGAPAPQYLREMVEEAVEAATQRAGRKEEKERPKAADKRSTRERRRQ